MSEKFAKLQLKDQYGWVQGRVSSVNKFMMDFIQVEIPIFYEAYHTKSSGRYYTSEAYHKFSGEYEKPVCYRPDSIFCLEELDRSILDGYITDESLPF